MTLMETGKSYFPLKHFQYHNASLQFFFILHDADKTLLE